MKKMISLTLMLCTQISFATETAVFREGKFLTKIVDGRKLYSKIPTRFKKSRDDCSSRADAIAFNQACIDYNISDNCPGGKPGMTQATGGMYTNCWACDDGLGVPSVWISSECGGDLGGNQDATNTQKTSEQCNSIIQTANQVVGEMIPIVGVPFSLYYFTSRVMGRKADYTFKVVCTKTNVYSAITSFDVTITDPYGVQVYSGSLPAQPNTYSTYVWDGMLNGTSTWGAANFTSHTLENATDVNLSMDKMIPLGNFKAIKLGLGGWTPSIWHFYDFASNTLYKGDGGSRTVKFNLESVTNRIYVPEEDGSLVYYFDGVGRIVETKHGLTGATLYTFTYDSNSQHLATIADSFSRVTTFNYDSNGYLRSITAPNGKVTTATLDANGYLASVTNLKGEMYHMHYVNADGLLDSFTSPNGLVGTMTYDSQGNFIHDVNSLGNSTTLTKTGLSVSLSSAMNRQITSTVNGTSGTVTETLVHSDGGTNIYTNTDTSASTSTPNSSSNTTYAADSRFNNLTRYPTNIAISDFGTKTSSIVQTQTLSDSSNPYSLTTKQIQVTTGPAIDTMTYSFGTGGQYDVTTTSKLGRTRKISYDQYGRPLVSHAGVASTGLDTNYTYMNDHLTQVQTGTRSTNYQYDSTTNLLSSTTNSMGQATAVSFDNAERMTALVLPDLRMIQFEYDSSGNLTSVTPPGRFPHYFFYQGNDLMAGYTPPAFDCVHNPATQYTYNLDKQLTSVSRPDGQVINYNYDATKGYLNSISGSFSEQFGYDSYGRLSQKTLPNMVSFNLYAGDTLRSRYYTDTSSNVIYRYFLLANTVVGQRIGRIIMVDAGTNQSDFNYSYDDDGYITQIGALALQWDLNKNLLQGTSVGSVADSYTYNDYREVSNYQSSRSTAQLYNEDLTRDALGRITQKVETINGTANTYVYTYDVAGRLSTVTKNGILISTYIYDSNSNRNGGSVNGISIAAHYDQQDRMTDYGTDQYIYNANGDLTQKTSTITGATTSYQYDVFGSLLQVTSSTKTVAYNIDTEMHRFEKKVNGVVIERYAYDLSGRLVAVLDSNNNFIKIFVYGSKQNIPDYFVDTSGNIHRVISDTQGSVKLIVKESDGTVEQQMDYDEFGRVIQDTNPGFQPFGFAGGHYDFDTGLIRFGARDYDPEIGRWTSKDPILFKGKDTNLYGYVMNDPVNLIDPKGTSWQGILFDTVLSIILYGDLNHLSKQLQNTLDQQKQLAELQQHEDDVNKAVQQMNNNDANQCRMCPCEH